MDDICSVINFIILGVFVFYIKYLSDRLDIMESTIETMYKVLHSALRLKDDDGEEVEMKDFIDELLEDE